MWLSSAARLVPFHNKTNARFDNVIGYREPLTILLDIPLTLSHRDHSAYYTLQPGLLSLIFAQEMDDCTKRRKIEEESRQDRGGRRATTPAERTDRMKLVPPIELLKVYQGYMGRWRQVRGGGKREGRRGEEGRGGGGAGEGGGAGGGGVGAGGGEQSRYIESYFQRIE